MCIFKVTLLYESWHSSRVPAWILTLGYCLSVNFVHVGSLQVAPPHGLAFKDAGTRIMGTFAPPSGTPHKRERAKR